MISTTKLKSIAIKFLFVQLILFVLTIVSSFILFNKQAEAAYNGAKLIDNAAFLNAASMNQLDIQNFLVSKGGALASDSFVIDCDAAGNQAKQAYLSLGAPCGQVIPVSQIIYYVSQVYGINPQVILTTMQKEQSLITATNPTNWQYSQAMGYGCPTSGSCSDSSNFFWQVDNGTWVLRFHYERARGNNSWWYTSNSWTCGTEKSLYKPNLYPNQNVSFYDQNGVLYRTYYIENAATSSMYCYTPHAYNNPNGLYGREPYGTVGMYYSGSYNFVYFFERWFDPISTILGSVKLSTNNQPDSTPFVGQTVTYTVGFTNQLSEAITFDAIGVVGRQNSLTGKNKDLGWAGPITIQPNSSVQRTFTVVVNETGTLYAWPAINYQGMYIQYNNWGMAMSVRKPNISLLTPQISSISNPVAGQSTTVIATIRNNELESLNINTLNVAVRYYGVYKYDPSPINVNGNVLAPNSTITLEEDILLDKAGPYIVQVYGLFNGLSYSFSDKTTINAAKPTPSFTLSYIETPNASPALGEDVKLSFKLKNNLPVPITLDAVGVVGRSGSPFSSINNDFGWIGNQVFSAGEEKTFTTFVKRVKSLDKLFVWPAINYKGAYTQYNKWGFMLNPRVPNITISQNIRINQGEAINLGSVSNITVSIINNEPKNINFNNIGIPIRFYSKYNYDAYWSGAGKLIPGEQLQLTGSVVFDKNGPYSIWPSINFNGLYITIGNVSTIEL